MALTRLLRLRRTCCFRHTCACASQGGCSDAAKPAPYVCRGSCSGNRSYPTLGCGPARNAERHDPSLVNRIDLHQLRGSRFECVKTIESRETIGAIAAQVDRFRRGWRPVLVTPPAGRLRVVFRANADDSKQPVFCIAVCPRKNGGEIVTDIGGRAHARDISEAELGQLLTVLGLERKVLEELK